jgi:integrase
VDQVKKTKGSGFQRTQLETGIRLLGPDRWEVVVHIGRDPLTGKLRQRSRTTRAGIRAARKLRAEMMHEVGQEEAEREKISGAATFGQLLDRWVDHGRRRGRSPNTIAGYEKKIDSVIRPQLGEILVADLTSETLDSFYDRLIDAGTSPATVMHYHRIISAALTQSRKWKAVASNVAQDASPPPVQKKPMTVPSPENVRALIELAATSRSPEWSTVITLAALTGMRRGELCGLQWQDVDWQGQAIAVQRSIWQTKAGWGEKDTKTHQVRRLVLGAQTMGVLAGRYKRVTDNVNLAEIDLSPEAYVFSPALDGATPMLPGAVTLAFRRLCKTMAERTGEEWPYRFHDLRHYSATELFRAGHHARTVADRLGHADPSITLRVYTHDTADQAAAAAASLEAGVF